MWKAVTILDGTEVVIASSGRYTEMLDHCRQWLSEQDGVWFELPKPAHLLSTIEMEDLGIQFLEEAEEVEA